MAIMDRGRAEYDVEAQMESCGHEGGLDERPQVVSVRGLGYEVRCAPPGLEVRRPVAGGRRAQVERVATGRQRDAQPVALIGQVMRRRSQRRRAGFLVDGQEARRRCAREDCGALHGVLDLDDACWRVDECPDHGADLGG